MPDRIGGSENVVRVYPHKRLCDETRCIVYTNGSLLYSDGDHLSPAGADYVLPELEPIFTAGSEATSALPAR